MDFPNLKMADCSDPGKGLRFRETLCPQLEELVVTLNGTYGSGVNMNVRNLEFEKGQYGRAVNVHSLNSALRSLDLDDLLSRLQFHDNGGAVETASWSPVMAQVHPSFKLTVAGGIGNGNGGSNLGV